MQTSHAATTITMIAKTWPSMLPHMRAYAISAMFAALSMSSRQSSTTSGLRRVSTPPAPMQNTRAETTRYQLMFTGRSPASSRRRRRPARRWSRGRRATRLAGRPGGAETADRRADPALDGLGHRADAGRPQERHRADARLLLVDPAAAAGEADRADGRAQQQ